jgi:alkylation response protein AidB-like acyl-CoA dehydrogenase
VTSRAAPTLAPVAVPRESLIDTARALGPTISAAGEWIDRERRLPPDLVAALIDAGLFRMLLPASLGGLEVDLPTFVRVVEEVAKADASTAWCIGQANGLNAQMAYLEPEVARSIFRESRQVLANGPGVGNRPGIARPAEGGYTISGRWMFASGSQHATWLIAICQLHSADGLPRFDANDQPELRSMLIPVEAAEFTDIWHVSGLRGTGSNQFSVTDLFVPATHAIWYTPKMRCEPGRLYLFPGSAIFAPAFASVALGVARTALDAFMELAGSKTPRGVGHLVRDNAVVQSEVARAEGRLRSAHALLHQTLGDVWDAVVTRGELLLEERVAIRLAASHATHEATAVVDVAYAGAGGTAIFTNQAFERRFRDVHAVTQQLQGRAQHFEAVGRFLLGLEPNSPFL